MRGSRHVQPGGDLGADAGHTGEIISQLAWERLSVPTEGGWGEEGLGVSLSDPDLNKCQVLLPCDIFKGNCGNRLCFHHDKSVTEINVHTAIKLEVSTGPRMPWELRIAMKTHIVQFDCMQAMYDIKINMFKNIWVVLEFRVGFASPR